MSACAAPCATTRWWARIATLAAPAADRFFRVPAATPADPAALLAFIEHARERAGAVRVMPERPLRSRIARMQAARIAPGRRARLAAPAAASRRVRQSP